MTKRTLLFSLALLSGYCGRVALAAGTVQQSGPDKLGETSNYVFAYRWTGDASTGSVPVTAARLGGCCQGYFITQVEIVPGSTAPTSGYSVAILDSSGTDYLNGAAVSLSATAAQSIATPSSSPPIQGTFSLSITGQSVSSATGTVYVFMAKPGTVNLALLRSLGNAAITSMPVANIATFGAACNGTTNDTVAVQAAFNWASGLGGGAVYVPVTAAGCLITGKITLPNDSHSPIPAQKSLRLLGNGGCTTGLLASQPTSAGSTLVMTYAGTGGKITTLGTGYLEVSGVCFRDTSIANTTPFLYDTNTVLWVHDNAYWGSFGNPLTTQDVIILGGDTDVRDGTIHAPFGGYGTRIEGNFFDKVRRAVYGHVFANGIVFSGNTIGQGGGGDAAVYFSGNDTLNTGYRSDGGVIANNTIELTGYTAGIKLDYTSKFSLTNNNFYDYDGNSMYGILLTANSQYTTIAGGTATTGGPPYVTDLANLASVLCSTDQSASPCVSKFNLLQMNNNFNVFSTLGSATAGLVQYCHDCVVATPCAGSGSGAWAFANGSRWACPF